MKKQDNEFMEQWAERVWQYEYQHALKAIRAGADTEEVMLEMSKRIAKKMLHPVFLEIKKSKNT